MRLPLLILTCSIACCLADEIGTGKKAPDAMSPEASIKSFSVADSLQVQVWASEPLLANPVAFTFDDAGRAYVAETYRRRSSVLDIRKYDDWKVPNLALRSVEDRIAFIKNKFPESAKMRPSKEWQDFNQDGAFDWRDMTLESERVRLVEDKNGDGRADEGRVLAEGFNSLETTVGAGIVADGKGGVFYTCSPDLWRITADGTKTKLLTGFSVHLVFSGHEMHGARLGPDGRLYFTIADCGAEVVNKEGVKISNPDSGAVFRCWPDGTGFELYAKGLRNPQHIAFNDLGDLFTGDNNADGGDKARWIHVVQGADYGWRIGWQFLPKLGLWNSEGMFFLNGGETNPAILGPVAHVGHGPAGIAYYPGTGLPEQFSGHFFYADFPGGIRHFALKPKGATYTTADFVPDAPILQNNQPSEMKGKLIWNMSPSDVQFAPGGGVMVLDWTTGWEKTGKGRIYRVFSPEADKNPLTQETKRLLNEGFAKRSVEELGRLLGHADQRVRLGAQIALAEQAKDSAAPATKALEAAAKSGGSVLARIHAIWGLGNAARNQPAMLDSAVGLLADSEAEVRAQAVKVLIDTPSISPNARKGLVDALEKLAVDPAPRVRFFALQAAGKLGWDAQRLIGLIPDNQEDPMLRHALSDAFGQVFAKAGERLPSVELLRKSASEKGESVVLNGLRKAGRPECAEFLVSANPLVRVEAARAIHDEPIIAAQPKLVEWLKIRAEKKDPLAGKNASEDLLLRRAVNVAYRIGTKDSAAVLTSVASRVASPWIPESTRLDALDALANWSVVLGRDRVLGVVLSQDGKRDRGDAAAALSPAVPTLLKDESAAIRIAAANAAGALKAASAEPLLASIAIDAKTAAALRVAALKALGEMDSSRLEEAVRAALTSTDTSLAGEARRLSTKLGGTIAIETNSAVLGKGTIVEQQEALGILAKAVGKQADQIFAEQLDLLAAGKLPAALHLDVLEGAAARSSDEVKTKLAAYEAKRPTGDPMARWQECLEGGDAKVGRTIFAEKAEAGCMRCHAVKKDGGDVGPDLGGLAGKRDRAYLLRAVVEPNADIAPGYENNLITLNNGDVLAGMANKEDATTLTLKNPADGKLQDVKKADIKDRQKLPSAMPPGLGDVLGKRDLRDLVAYLASLKK